MKTAKKMVIEVDGLIVKNFKKNSIFFCEEIRQFVRVVKIGKKKISVVDSKGDIIKIKKEKIFEKTS